MGNKYPRMSMTSHVGQGESVQASVDSASLRVERPCGRRPLTGTMDSGDLTKWEVMARTLADGLVYLGLQDDKLSAVGGLLDDFLAAFSRPRRSRLDHKNTSGRLAGEIIALSLEGLMKEKHKGVPLFDDGSSPPLKFNVLESGRRRTIEIPKGNLSKPALTALRVCGGRSSPGKDTILEAVKEILQLRTLNHSQALKLESVLASIESKMLNGRRNRAILLGGKSVSGSMRKMRTPSLSPSAQSESLLAVLISRTGKLLGMSRPVVTPMGAS